MSVTDTQSARNSNPPHRPQTPAEPPRPVRPLPNSQDYICPLNISEGSWGTLWGVTARIGDTLEDMQDMRYWELIAEKLRKDDMIQMRFNDDDRYEFFAVRKVWRVGNAIHPNRAIVQHLPERRIELRPAEMVIDTGDFQIRFDGPKQGWSVWDVSRNAKVAEGMPSKEDAQRRAEQLAAASKQKQNVGR